jgi:hypothetical protein
MKTSIEYKKKIFKGFGYEPHDGQKVLHFGTGTKRFVVFICGRRWGKSVAAAKEIESVILQEDKRAWIVAPTYSLADKVFREVYADCVTKHQMPILRKSEKDQFINFAWGSTFEAKSATNPDNLVGEGLDLLVIDEAAKIKEDLYNKYLRATVSDRKGDVLFITTPEGFNWVYDRYILPEVNNNWFSYNSPTWQNNIMFPDGYEDEDLKEARATMSEEEWSQEYCAKFVSFAGMVYKFKRETDTGTYPYDPNKPTYCAMDVGYRMPAVGWWQIAYEGGVKHFYLIDCIAHEKNITTPELGNMIKEKPYKVVRYYGDPAGRAMQGAAGMSDYQVLSKILGKDIYYTLDSQAVDIKNSVNHVRSILCNAEGIRRIHVDKVHCAPIIQDFEGYRYPEKSHMDTPLKDGINEHGMDMVRYFFTNIEPIKRVFVGTSSRG